MKIRIPQFTQTNVAGILERADNILLAIKELNTDHYTQEAIITTLIEKLEPGDEWELASLRIAAVELMERRIRHEDPQCEKFPADWNGGLLEKKE